MAVVIDGSNGISSPDYEVDGVTGQIYPLVSGTAVTASGTSIDFTGIPSWVKRITVMLSGVSTNGTSPMLFQIGAGAIQTTGYTNAATRTGATATALTNSTAGVPLATYAATNTVSGACCFSNLTSNTWVASFVAADAAAVTFSSAGTVTLSGSLDRLRITTVGGANTFDAGTINIIYE